MKQLKNCLFCQIAQAKTGKIEFDLGDFVAFKDINPRAEYHYLIIPKEHIANLDELIDPKLTANLIFAAKEVASKLKLDSGYRLILNNKAGGGQVVNHLHLHLLAGKGLADF